MSLGLNLQQRLVQKLAMTPQMQQSIQLLQLTSLELEQLAEQEMLENPFLEMSEEGETLEEQELSGEMEVKEENSSELESEREVEDIQDRDTDEVEMRSSMGDSALSDENISEENMDISDGEVASSGSDVLENFKNIDKVDTDWETIFDDSENRVYAQKEDTEENDFTQYVAKQISLYDDLIKQLHWTILKDVDFKIGEYIIGSLNQDGYLVTPLEDIANTFKLPVERIEKVLKIIQTFEPVGIAARDLRECLLIQIDDKGIKNPLVRRVVENYFSDFKKKKIHKIAHEMGVTDDAVLEVFNIVSRLEPKPGRTISTEQSFYITADVVVKKVENKYICYLNDGEISRLRINPYYKKVLINGNHHSPKEKEYAVEKYKAAIWLLRNIEKRKSTILKVTEAIINHQKDFLNKGMGHLKPLTLRQIADEVSMHESTVARVTASKYVETPRGTFLLKYFFSSGLGTDSGDDTSSTNIKDMIRGIIVKEDPKKPLSDEVIAKMLNNKGIQIARRTVAKYREQLKILPAKLRKTI